MTRKTTIFTHRPHVSLARFSFCWCHNRLLMTSQWPDNCDAITWIVISNSLDINFIHGDIHGRSGKKMGIKKKKKQGKSEGFDSCDRPSNLTQIGFKLWIFRPCDLEIWWMTPKNNKARLLYNIKLCVSFHIHQWIQTGVTVRKHPIWLKLDDFLSCVTLQFDLWPWKTIGHLFYATSCFVHHFLAIGELKLELQSGSPQFGSNSTIFRAVWPWNLTDDLEKQ